MPLEPEAPFEDAIGEALRRAAAGFDPDSRRLATAGLERGRTLRRRRGAAIGGGVAGLALIAAGGVLATGLAGQAHGTARPTSPVSPTAPHSDPAEPVTAQQMISLLQGLLPKGTTTGAVGRGTPAAGDRLGLPPSVQLVYDDGHGAAEISLEVSHAQVPPPASGCPATAQGPGASCERTRLPGGGTLLVTKGFEFPDRRVDTKLWSATATLPDGQQVYAAEWNAPAEKGVPVTRAEPPLTTGQLGSLAADPAWKHVYAAIPAAPKASQHPSPPPTGPSSSAMAATVESLLPAGLRAAVAQDQTGGQYVALTVDDGHGKGWVQINDQPDMSDVKDQLFGGATTLPNGTLVAVHQGAAQEPGVVSWTVDTIRPDGRRVVISEMNASGNYQHADRPAPVLTIAQLTAIATSAKWEALR